MLSSTESQPLLCRGQQQGLRLWEDGLRHLLQQLEDAGAERDRDAEDDALGDAADGVGARVDRRLEEVVGRLLEGGEHEHRLLHLRHAKARDAEHLSAEAHDVCEQRDVPAVDLHPVLPHRVLDLVHDGLPRRLDAERLLDLGDVRRSRRAAAHAAHAEHVPQPGALDEQLVAGAAARLLHLALLALLLLRDDGARHLLDAAYQHCQQHPAQPVQLGEGEVLAAGARRVHAHLCRGAHAHVIFVQLHLRRGEDGGADGGDGDGEVEPLDEGEVELDRDVALHQVVHLDDGLADLAELGPLHPPLDHARGGQVERLVELGLDDWRRDLLGGVDDLLDARHAERDVHRGDARKVERLERHLRARLADRLRADRSNGGAGLHLAREVLAHARAQEAVEDLPRQHVAPAGRRRRRCLNLYERLIDGSLGSRRLWRRRLVLVIAVEDDAGGATLLGAAALVGSGRERRELGLAELGLARRALCADAHLGRLEGRRREGDSVGGCAW
mmetsp:Transcript_2271/g.6883  ORF Transcript_2271/g.6883 Transcript_2271/m.6883 type:complete len:501 (-) Transcript_2271:667-2169(-)